VLCVADAESALAEERRLRSVFTSVSFARRLYCYSRCDRGWGALLAATRRIETHKRVVVALRKPMPQQRRRRAISGANLVESS